VAVYFEIYDRRSTNAWQCLQKLIVVVRTVVNRRSGLFGRGLELQGFSLNLFLLAFQASYKQWK
jgi:hypothetical protein